MIYKILEFIREAGKIAIYNQANIDIFEEHITKETSSASDIVTKTDLEISKLFNSFVRANFSDLNYIIVDEETVDCLGSKPVDKIAKSEYAFVIDPIDGTHPYSVRMPEYAISVGILKYGKPYIGVVYAPALKELVYFDGDSSYWLQNVGLDNERKEKLVKRKVKYNSFVFQSVWDIRINDKVDYKRDCIVSLYSAVVHLLYVITGRGKAWHCKVFLWDVAGAWPILNNLGFGMYNYDNQEEIKELSGKDFSDKLRHKHMNIVCQLEDFDRVKSFSDVKN